MNWCLFCAGRDLKNNLLSFNQRNLSITPTEDSKLFMYTIVIATVKVYNKRSKLHFIEVVQLFMCPFPCPTRSTSPRRPT